MGRKILIENIAAEVTGTQLSELIGEHGQYESIDLSKDEKKEENTQVAFVIMKSAKHGRAVIAALNGKTLGERPLKIRALKQNSEGNNATSGLAGGPSRRRFGGRGGIYGGKGQGKIGGRFR
jgi:RNA recognition motif-containing protein